MGSFCQRWAKGEHLAGIKTTWLWLDVVFLDSNLFFFRIGF